MKRLVAVCGLLLGLALPASAGEPTTDETIEQFDGALAKLVTLLKEARDPESARSASDRLAELDWQVGSAFDRLKKSQTPPGEAAAQKLPAIQKSINELDQQLIRIGRLPGAAEVLDKLPASKALLSEQQKARVERARVDVRNLTLAVEAYRARFGQLPPKLEALMTPPQGLPLIEPKPETLLDPWGRPYRYDLAGPRNKGVRPDIWSEGPDPKDETRAIGNWMRES